MKRRDLLKGIAATLAGLVPFGLRARSRGHVRIEIVTGDADVVRVWIDDQEIACNTFEISVELRPLLEHDNTIYRSKAAAVEAQETLLGYPVIYS